jgi:hypothetical protein
LRGWGKKKKKEKEIATETKPRVYWIYTLPKNKAATKTIQTPPQGHY